MGTYNNQWMALDVNSKELVITEQIPGLIKTLNVTNILHSQGYWASYNIPYDQEIYNISGYELQNLGNEFSYQKCPRANIFRNRSKVSSVEDLKNLMQYNDWQNDPLSLGSPVNAIASRFDLLPANSSFPMGGIDSKVQNKEMLLNRSVSVINGPTHQTQSPFVWTSEFDYIRHEGLPRTFDYNYTTLFF